MYFMKKSGIKILALVFCISMLVTMFSGCGEKAAEPAETAAATDAAVQTPAETSAAEASEAYAEPVTLTFLIDNQATLDGVNAIFAEIEKKYNIKTEVELRPGGSDGDNLVKTRLATGDMADICAYNSGSLFMALNPQQYFADLTNEPFMANVMDSFKTCVTVDGKVYGIPNGGSMSGAWLYNKKVYAELGLSVPKTWEELLANCEKVKAAGKTAVIGSYKDSWTSQLILLADFYNVQLLAPSFAADYTANKAKFADTPAALRGFEKLAEINAKGYMNKDYLATTYDIALKMLAEGTGAHYPMLTFALSAIKASYPDKAEDIGLFAQPGDSADKNGLTVWMPGGIYFNKDGNVEAEMKWASYFVSPEGCETYMSKQLPDGPLAIKGAKLPDNVLPAVKDMMPYFDNGNNAPALEFLSAIKGPNLPQICVEAGSGIKPAADCAKEYDKDVEKQAKQLGIAGW
jgi:raffinose/stachyose/melibiose transport system substrate-binding protein